MTNVQTRNVKLRERAIRILQGEAGLNEEQAQRVLDEAGGQLPVALVMCKSGSSKADAETALAQAQGVISSAIDSLKLR
jgi:N-acetylmuramic acid 6-phosphate etherase